MQCSIFNLPFQIFIYHPITSNKCNNAVPPLLNLYIDTPVVVLEQEQSYITRLAPAIIN